MTVKIADFGLSQQLALAKEDGGERLPNLTEVCGTPDYFAPELAEIAAYVKAQKPAAGDGDGADDLRAGENLGDISKGYGPPLDCWAVGCIVYEMLAGRPPYQANNEDVLFPGLTQCTHSPLHACTLLTVARDCVWCRCSSIR